MKYTLIIKKTAQKQILGLPKPYYDKVKRAILALESDPRPNGCKKLTGSDDIYRIRIGIYRVIYSIEDGQLIIFVFDVEHRKDAYK